MTNTTPWIAIINLQNRPRVIMGDDDDPAEFEDISEIVKLKSKHILRKHEWYAFNYETGQSEDIL
jgi:hypothetical protein